MTERFKAWSVGLATTPFKTYAAFFRPDELDALTAAYDAAWRHLWATSVRMTAAQASDLKNRLAQIILASACTGERDIERLSEIALRGVSGPSLVKEPEPEHC
jgi:hypothetical protein